MSPSPHCCPARNRPRGAAQLNQARYSIAWGVIGAAQACLDETIAYLKQRVQFDGKPRKPSTHPVQARMDGGGIDVDAIDCETPGRTETEGRENPAQVSLAKMNNCRKARSRLRGPAANCSARTAF